MVAGLWRLAGLGLALAAGRYDVSKHNVTWEELLPEPGKNSEGDATYLNSMPVGNGHIAANVLYELAEHKIKVIVSASSAWSEAGELLKVALLEVQLNASLASGLLVGGFKQVFDPQTATVNITLGELSALIYVDANSDTLLVELSSFAFVSGVQLLPLRTASTSEVPAFDCRAYTTSADVVKGDNVVYHWNAGQGPHSEFMVSTFSATNTPLDDSMADPLLRRGTGAQLLVDASLKRVAVAVLTAQAATNQEFETKLDAVARAAPAAPYADHAAWWSTFWDRSHIEVSGEPALTQLYVLQRYLQAVQARSPYPIKFNGMLFTANRAGKADFRQWGGLNWWQNLRLPYYNMNSAGDSDMLLTLLLQFESTVPVARARTKHYFGFDGIWWPEYTHPLYGTTHPSSYGCNRTDPSEPIWHSQDVWNGYNRQGSLDLSLLILDYLSHTQGDDQGLLEIPIGVIQFYQNLWGNTTDAYGNMVFFPTQAVETWQCPGWPVDPTNCPTNDMPTIAGLRAVLEKLIQLPGRSADEKASWSALLKRVPPLPSRDGKFVPCDTCNKSAPAASPGCHHTSNVENPELYVVHPYRLATVARGDAESLKMAQAAFDVMLFPSDDGWNQNAMDAALLGSAAKAKNYVLKRAAAGSAPGYRFPAFAPHMQDYEPSSDHYGVMNNALVYMLLAPKDDEQEGVLLLPAWPCEWDVQFKLHAPRRTVIEGRLLAGALSFTVSPPERAAAVQAGHCQRTVHEEHATYV